jgi:hypothetical protein
MPMIPGSASDDITAIIDGDTPPRTIEVIPNPFPGKDVLTRFEAMDAINMLSAMLMADERHRGG